MAEESRTIAYICPHCRQSVIVQRTVFQLAAAPLEIPCPCGKSALRTELMGPRTRFEVPCVACGRTHAVECDTHDVLPRRALAFSCSATGLDCCYVGEEQAVYAAVRRLEGAVDKLHAEAGERGAFLDEIVMHEILSELRDIAQRGGVSCTCGSREWRLKVNYSSVELTCARCGGTLRIPAATEEDITDLCCKPALQIHGR